MSPRRFIHTLRVYYEDTDAGGVVYYANYLKYLERARTEALRELGFDQPRLLTQEGLAFVVRAITADYRKPARLDDALEVRSTVSKIGRASLEFSQVVTRGDTPLLEASVLIACVHLSLQKPAPLPGDLLARLKEST